VANLFVLYSENSPNAFRRRRRRGSPPAKIRKGGGATPLTILSFSLAANSFNPLNKKDEQEI